MVPLRRELAVLAGLSLVRVLVVVLGVAGVIALLEASSGGHERRRLEVRGLGVAAISVEDAAATLRRIAPAAAVGAAAVVALGLWAPAAASALCAGVLGGRGLGALLTCRWVGRLERAEDCAVAGAAMAPR